MMGCGAVRCGAVRWGAVGFDAGAVLALRAGTGTIGIPC
jgi:hypothetical protein